MTTTIYCKNTKCVWYEYSNGSHMCNRNNPVLYLNEKGEYDLCVNKSFIYPSKDRDARAGCHCSKCEAACKHKAVTCPGWPCGLTTAHPAHNFCPFCGGSLRGND